MTEDSIPENQEAVAAEQSPGVGRTLQNAREEKGLRLDEVAHALKLQVRQLAAMEADEFASLGSPPHVKGFLRHYARHLGLDPEPMLASLEKAAKLPASDLHGINSTGVAMPVSGGRKPLSWVLALSPLLLVVAGGAVLYVVGTNLDRWRSDAAEEIVRVGNLAGASPETPAPVPAPAAGPLPIPAAVPGDAAAPAAASPETVPAPLAPATPSPAGSAPGPSLPLQGAVPAQTLPVQAATLQAVPAQAATPLPAPAAAVPAPASSVAAAGAHRLGVTCVKESWVEVKDGQGRTLLSQKVEAGQTRSLEGKPPFTLVIGNAAGVQVQYNSKAVDLAPYTRVNVARLTLE